MPLPDEDDQMVQDVLQQIQGSLPQKQFSQPVFDTLSAGPSAGPIDPAMMPAYAQQQQLQCSGGGGGDLWDLLRLAAIIVVLYLTVEFLPLSQLRLPAFLDALPYTLTGLKALLLAGAFVAVSKANLL